MPGHRPLARRTLTGLVSAALVAVAPGVGQARGGQDEPPDSIVAAQAQVRPVPAGARPVLAPVQRGTAPTADGVLAAVADEWDSSWLGRDDRRALSVRDVQTGETLLDRRSDEALTPASTVKLLSAAAVVSTLDPGETFPTRAVTGPEPGQVVLVAGGDLLLRAGAGSPTAVVGRAGLADLAEQVADALAGDRTETGDDPQATAAGPVRVLLDTTYAEGADTSPGWTDYWVDTGFAGRISMLGLQQDRAVPFDPSPADPPVVAAEAFRDALAEAGVDVQDREVVRTEAVDSDTADVLGEVQSAPVRDVLALALASSDNAMIEQLARQAAVRDGVASDQDSVNAWVLDRLEAAYGLDVAGTRLADTSGLSDGTQVPMRLVADVVVAGADGSHPGLQEVFTGLPIAGYTGTLFDRFLLDDAQAGVGVVRAKTGSLPGTSALAGTVVTADGRLLAFALTATDVGSDGAALEARAVIDAMVADLASCGC